MISKRNGLLQRLFFLFRTLCLNLPFIKLLPAICVVVGLASQLLTSSASAISSEALKLVRDRYVAFHKLRSSDLKNISSNRVTPGIGDQALTLKFNSHGAILHYAKVPYEVRDIEALFGPKGELIFYYLKYDGPKDPEILPPSDEIVTETRLYFVDGELERIQAGAAPPRDANFSAADVELSNEAKSFAKLIYRFVLNPNATDENIRILRKYLYPDESVDEKQESEMDPSSLVKLSGELNVDRAKNNLTAVLYFSNLGQYHTIALSKYDLDRDLFVQKIDSTTPFETYDLGDVDPATGGPHQGRRLPPSKDDIVYVPVADESKIERSYYLNNIYFYSREAERWKITRIKNPGIYKITFCYDFSQARAKDKKFLKLVDKKLTDHLWSGTVCSEPVTLDLKPTEVIGHD